MVIKIYDVRGRLLLSLEPNSGSIRRFSLMSEDYIELRFSMVEPIAFSLGDWCYIDGDGKFEITEEQKPTANHNTGGYDYTIKMEKSYMKIRNKLLLLNPDVDGNGETNWSLTAPISYHLGVFSDNLTALQYKYTFYKSGLKQELDYSIEVDYNVVSSEAKFISYDGVDMLSALNTMCSKENFDCEWWFDKDVLHIGKCQKDNKAVDFTIGTNVERISVTDSTTEKATRLYVFGGTRNIPQTYRKSLVFNVTNVNGNQFQDETRPIKAEYFKESDWINPFINYPLRINSTILSKTSTATYKQSFTSNTATLAAGKYVAFPTTSVISFNTNSKVVDLIKYNVELSYTSGGRSVLKKLKEEDIYVYSANAKINLDISKFEFSIDADAENTKFILSFEPQYQYSSSCTITYNVEAQYVMRREEEFKATNVIVVKDGVEYNAILNAEKDAEHVGVITLDRPIMSLGDIYTIKNIVRNACPASYFSMDSFVGSNSILGITENRLRIPINCTETNGKPYFDAKENQSQEESIVAVAVNDDIYPKQTNKVTSIETYTSTIKEEDGSVTEKTYYRLYADIDFDTKYIIDVETLKITFQPNESQTSLLSGMTFEVEYSESKKYFEVVVNEVYGRELPDRELYPQVGDSFVLTGYDTSYIEDNLVELAEKELAEFGKKKIAELQLDGATYTCEMMSNWVVNNGASYPIGTAVTIKDPAYSPGGRQSRVVGYEYKLDFPFDTPKYECGMSTRYSTTAHLQGEIDALIAGKGNQSGGGGQSINLIKSTETKVANDKTAYSSLRSKQEFVSKIEDDVVEGNISFVKSIKIGDATLVWDNDNKALKVDKTLYSTNGISALGFSEVTSGEGGGDTSALFVYIDTMTPQEIYESVEQGWKSEVWVIYNGSNREAKTTWLSNNVLQLSFMDYNKDYYVTITKDGVDYTREDSYVEYIE